MTTRRQMITDTLTQAKKPGPTADQVARKLGMSLHAVMNHIKHIRKACTVVATPHKHDARVKHYRIQRGKAEPTASQQPEQATTPPRQATKNATLSATELEAAIVNTLRTHASARRPMNMDNLRDQVQAPAALVRPAIIALVQRETVVRIKGGYHLPEAAKQTPGQTVAGPRVVDVMHGQYNGAELRPFNGRPGAMDAYKLPSRGMRA